ncbi:MAG: hypothetical protein AB7K52_13550 [Phycisphaerales bacterium]
MLKWLRKYSKALLIFFGVFLMIAFLMPQAISQIGQDAAQTLFTLDGRRVTAKEAQRKNMELNAVEMATFGMFPRIVGVDSSGSGGVDHWIMATEATRRAQFFGAAGDGPEIIPAAAEASVMSGIDPMFLAMAQQNPQLRDQIMQTIDQRITDASSALPTLAARNGLSERELDLGLAAAKGMFRMREAYLTAPRLSENRLIRRAREALDQAEMQVLFIGVEPALAQIPDPPEAALQEHFDRYKDKTAGVDESPFGYMRPRRYKLEWITLERAAIENAVKIDAIDVQKKLLAGEAKEITDAAARRSEIERRLKSDAVERVLSEARLAFKAEVLGATRSLATVDGFYVVPESWQRAPLAGVAERVATKVREQTGIAIPLPTINVRDAQWITDEDLVKLPGLGAATYRRGNGSVSVAQMLPFVKELRRPEEPRIDLPLQTGVPFTEPVTDFTGNQHYFTVIDARPASPAESLAEVRAEVINDRKKADAYAALAEKVSLFETLAIAQGFDALVEQARASGGVSTDLRSGVRVSRRQVSPTDFAANTKAFIDAAARKMDALDATVPLDKAPPGDLFVAVAAPAKLGVVVGKFTTFSPATSQRFRSLTREIARGAAIELVDTREELLGRERLIKVLNVEVPKGPPDETPPKPADKAKDTPSGADQPAPTPK